MKHFLFNFPFISSLRIDTHTCIIYFLCINMAAAHFIKYCEKKK